MRIGKNKFNANQLAAPGRLAKTPPLNTTLTSRDYQVDYFRFYESLLRKEVTDWQQARISRHDPFNPATYPLQQCYKDAMLDNHLAGAVENRILRVVNKQLIIKDKAGNPDPERTTYVQTRWFKHLLRRAMESKFYGYSLVYLPYAGSGSINEVADIPRENVIPEKRLLVKNGLNPNGESMRIDDYPYHLIYIQLQPTAFGLLEQVVPLTIFKRHSWAAWDEFEQVFGVPIRIARTMIDTEKHRDDLQNWLENMGQLSYGIFDKRVDLEIKENNRSDAFQVFSQKITLINKEISKAILGQTMTMDDGGSYSQANVHLDILNEITNADIDDVESWFNSYFIGIMRSWGYDFPDGHHLDVVANASLDPAKKIEIDEALMRNGWMFDKDYIERTYEVKLDEKQPRIEAAQQNLSLGEHDFFV